MGYPYSTVPYLALFMRESYPPAAPSPANTPPRGAGSSRVLVFIQPKRSGSLESLCFSSGSAHDAVDKLEQILCRGRGLIRPRQGPNRTFHMWLKPNWGLVWEHKPRHLLSNCTDRLISESVCAVRQFSLHDGVEHR